jgi:hypothetical protein
MDTYQQNTDGTWTPARPVPPTRLLRVERWLRRHGRHRLANALARWDEKGLGR